MEFLHRTVSVGLVWLTAATTLACGLPHVDCVCPNGQYKPFCLGVTASLTGCCCSTSPSETSADSSSKAQPKPFSCCHEGRRKPAAETHAAVAKITGGGCKRTLVRATVVGVSPAKAG